MVDVKNTRSHAAFHELVDLLRQTADEWLTAERGVETERDYVEGLRNVLHLLSAGIDFYLEGDAERPEFVRIVSPTRKFMGDNPDAVYHFARIRDDRVYRISGVRRDECYVSFTIHGRAEDGRLGAAAEPVLADLNDRGFDVSADGSYEVVLSREERPGNWIELPDGAASVITRHYFENEGTPAIDRADAIRLSIDSLDAPPPREPWSDASMAPRLRDVAAFVRGATVAGIDMPNPPPFVSRTPNELGEPTVFRMAGSDAWGAVDIAYSMGPYELGDGEALVLEGRLPECAFANVVLWNRYMQSFEYRDRRVSLNREQIRLESDGRYRIVISATDPGLPNGNWLDTEASSKGTIFWRFLLPESTPQKPDCRLVRLSEL